MKLRSTTRLAASLSLTLCFAAHVSAEVKPSALFSEHAVLQGDMVVPVWGTADPGEKVTVTLNGKTALRHGRRRRQMDGPSREAQSRRPVDDDASQGTKRGERAHRHSAMFWSARSGSAPASPTWSSTSRTRATAPTDCCDEEKEIAAANYPQLRMFTVADDQVRYDPQARRQGRVAGMHARKRRRLLCRRLPVRRATSTRRSSSRSASSSPPIGASTAEAWVPRDAESSRRPAA